MTDYKALFEEELQKVEPRYRQRILSDIASLEFEVEPYTDQELFEMLKEANKRVAAKNGNQAAA
ncbi:MAG: hypothetical protein V3U75_08745 [Methylococcaceae bacterium]